MKGQRSWVFLAWIAMIQLAVVMVLVPGNLVERAIQGESAMVQATMGIKTSQWLHGTAQSWVQSSLMDSGVYQAAYDFLIPTQAQRDNSRAIEDMGQGWFAWVHTRLDALVRVIFQFYARCALLLMWLPYALILFLPALFDGVVTRKIRQTNFNYSSPVVHHYSLRTLSILIVGLFILFFAPIALHPLIIPVALMMSCVLSGVMVGNLQKRV